jgi:hypothetical protein
MLSLGAGFLAAVLMPEIRSLRDVQTVIGLTVISEGAVVPAAFALIRFVKAVTAAQARAARMQRLHA